MPRLAIPLSDLQCRTAKTRERAYKLFDGLNTYYLAKEHLNLKPAFDIPPCNLDNFQLCRGHTFSHPLSDADQHHAAALQRAEQAEAQLHAIQNSRTWKALHKLRTALRRA